MIFLGKLLTAKDASRAVLEPRYPYRNDFVTPVQRWLIYQASARFDRFLLM
jgi:hypothetical protein